MKVVKIIEKEYLPEQQNLIDIFKQHAQGCMPELPVIFKLPRVAKYRNHFNRIPCKTIGGMTGYHLISMQVEDFVNGSQQRSTRRSPEKNMRKSEDNESG